MEVYHEVRYVLRTTEYQLLNTTTESVTIANVRGACEIVRLLEGYLLIVREGSTAACI